MTSQMICFWGVTVDRFPIRASQRRLVHEQGCLFVDGFSAHIGPPGQTGPKILYVFKLISKSTRTDRVIRSQGRGFEPHVGRVYFY
jgi:hypothetical protein